MKQSILGSVLDVVAQETALCGDLNEGMVRAVSRVKRVLRGGNSTYSCLWQEQSRPCVRAVWVV